MSSPKPEHARSGDVPHSARRTSSDRQQVVHLPDVRLRPTASSELARKGHALHVYAGVRRSPPRSTTGSSSSWGFFPPSKSRFDRLNLTYTLLSKRKTAAVGAGGPVVRGWGRPAYAYVERQSVAAATPRRRSAISAAPSASRKDHRLDRTGHAGAFCARGSKQAARPRVMARTAPVESRDRQLSRESDRRNGTR